MRRASQALDNNIGLLTRTRASGPASLLGGYRGVGRGRRLLPFSPTWGGQENPKKSPVITLHFPKSRRNPHGMTLPAPKTLLARPGRSQSSAFLGTTLGLIGV